MKVRTKKETNLVKRLIKLYLGRKAKTNASDVFTSYTREEQGKKDRLRREG